MGCRIPVQLEGMPVVTLELAIAVAQAGGLAMRSAVRAPLLFLMDTLEKVISCTEAPIGLTFEFSDCRRHPWLWRHFNRIYSTRRVLRRQDT